MQSYSPAKGAPSAPATTGFMSGATSPVPGDFGPGVELYGPNLTPDPTTGIGTWTDDQLTDAILNGIDALSGEYRVVLAGQGPYDLLPLEVETATNAAPAPGLADAVAAGIKRELGVTARVNLLPFGALPRTDGKTRRVFRGDGT